MVISAFKPTFPPVIPTEEATFKATLDCECEMVYGVPSLIEVMLLFDRIIQF